MTSLSLLALAVDDLEDFSLVDSFLRRSLRSALMPRAVSSLELTLDLSLAAMGEKDALNRCLP